MVRLRPGRIATLVDLSEEGAALELQTRLLPGTTVVLQLLGKPRRVTVSGRVLRCSVSRIEPSVGPTYRGAVGFAEKVERPRDGGGPEVIGNGS